MPVHSHHCEEDNAPGPVHGQQKSAIRRNILKCPLPLSEVVVCPKGQADHQKEVGYGQVEQVNSAWPRSSCESRNHRGDAVAQDAEHKARGLAATASPRAWYPWMRQHDLLAMVDRGPVLRVLGRAVPASLPWEAGTTRVHGCRHRLENRKLQPGNATLQWRLDHKRSISTPTPPLAQS